MLESRFERKRRERKKEENSGRLVLDLTEQLCRFFLLKEQFVKWCKKLILVI